MAPVAYSRCMSIPYRMNANGEPIEVPPPPPSFYFFNKVTLSVAAICFALGYYIAHEVHKAPEPEPKPEETLRQPVFSEPDWVKSFEVAAAHPCQDTLVKAKPGRRVVCVDPRQRLEVKLSSSTPFVKDVYVVCACPR